MRDNRSHIVADGRRRILAGPRYQAASHALRHKMKRRCAPLPAKSSLVGKLIIHFRIRRCVQCQLNKIAPPQAFYLRRAVRRSRFTSNQSLQLTAGRCDDQVEFMKEIVDVAKARFRQR
jgi:hypothetical protein